MKPDPAKANSHIEPQRDLRYNLKMVFKAWAEVFTTSRLLRFTIITAGRHFEKTSRILVKLMAHQRSPRECELNNTTMLPSIYPQKVTKALAKVSGATWPPRSPAMTPEGDFAETLGFWAGCWLV